MYYPIPMILYVPVKRSKHGGKDSFLMVYYERTEIFKVPQVQHLLGNQKILACCGSGKLTEDGTLYLSKFSGANGRKYVSKLLQE